jgi:hypothetical protein
MTRKHRHPRRDSRAGGLNLAFGTVLVNSGAMLVYGRGVLNDIFYSEISKGLCQIALAVIGTVLFATGFRFVHKGKQLLAREGLSVLQKSGKAPVLYLRPFNVDKEAFAKSEGLGLWRFVPKPTFEEEMAGALEKVGPFIAVGAPGEELQTLGAARIYTENSDWHDYVRSLMKIAQLVILVVGRSDAILWEVTTAVQIVDPRRFLLCLPLPNKTQAECQSEWELFLLTVGSIFPHSLPESIDSAYFLRFDGDWVPHLVEPRVGWLSRFATQGKWPRLQFGLEAALAELGILQRTWRYVARNVAFQVLGAIILVVVVALFGFVLFAFLFLMLKA